MASTIKPTQPSSKLMKLLAEKLGQADAFAREPFGYPNPPVALISDLLGVPAVQRTMERVAYGEPLTTGKGLTTRMRPDTEETLLAGTGLIQPVGALTRAASNAAMKAGRAGEQFAERAVPKILERGGKPAQLLQDLAMGNTSNVIKLPGGNWLNGSVEDALKGLHKEGVSRDAAIQARSARLQGLGIAERHGPGMNAYGEALSDAELSRELATTNRNLPARMNPQLLSTGEAALNQFIDKQLTRYVKNDMATERDPIRALAEKGTLHYAPNEELGWIPESLVNRRQLVGANPDGTAVSNLAKQWEQRADSSVQALPAGKYQKEVGPGWESNMWLDKTAPDVPVHSPMYTGSGRTSRDLGFDHLIDELRNATNPASGLPRELLIKPESLDRVSVPQAVEHVAKINAWREAQKVEANAAIANNAATHVFKEYAENNPKGLKWVELKQGKLPDDWAEEFIDTDLGKLRKFRDPKTGGLTATDPTEEALRAALKYEGDTMGHCVGGYCDDVASGQSRIYSLRDSKGQPHVTIEAKLGAGPEWAGEKNKEIIRLAEERGIQRYMAPGNEDLWAEAERNLAARGIEQPKYIQQIKGKGNKKPNDEYLPFVQDFVKSGKWSDVGDLQNTGLIDARSLKDSYKTTPEFYEAMSAKYGTDFWPDTDAEWKAFTSNGYKVPPEGFAAGGPVSRSYGDDPAPAAPAAPAAVPPTSGYGDSFDTWVDPTTAAANAADAQRRAAHTAANRMTREEFLRKYGTTFVADDRGGNAASEVAGQDVGQYYDRYLAEGATGDLVIRHWDSEIPEGTRAMPDFGWKYRDANPYFDAWDNVDPHPESQDLGGVGEFWRQIGRPVATAAATYFGVGALGGALGGAGAASTAASTAAPAAALDGGLAAAASSSEGLAALQAANAGSGAMGSGLGSMAAGTAAPTLTAAQNAAIAASIPQQASGLAGLVGMNAGYGASALNSGALNTAVGLARGQNIGEALRGGVTAAALSPIGGYVSNAVGGGALGTIAGNTATGGAQGLVSGRGLTDGLQQGLVSGLVSAAGDYAGGVARGATGSRFAGTAANALTRSTLRGQRPGSTLDSLATQYAAGEISDLSGLDPAVASIVVNLARNKRVSPVGALSALNNTRRAVGS